MSILNRWMIGLALLGSVVSLGGCGDTAKKAEEARLLAISTPLPHDPTDKFEIGPWWSDGKHLLNLRADGGYSLFADNNRYTRPVDRGRWGQQNYATLWLEPYTGLAPQRVRVAITRIDGRIALQPPKYGTMFEIPAPPPVMEDRLIGQWQGTMGSLWLQRDLTYVFTPAPGAVTATGRIMAGHTGRWLLSGDQLTLTPTTSAVSAVVLTIRHVPAPSGDAQSQPTESPEPVIEGLGGELIKVKAAEA